jgi:hypothetical protein
MVMFGLMGTGVASVETAPALTNYVGGALLAGGVAIGALGLRPSKEACCILWGETPVVRLKKAAKVAVMGFALAAGANTLMGRGLSNPAVTAEAISFAQAYGSSAFDILSNICTGRAPGLNP